MNSRITMFTTPGVKDFAEAVDAERQRQWKKWGDQQHPDGTGLPGDVLRADNAREVCDAMAARGETTWRGILAEEVAEAFAETDPEKLLVELDQSAAVIAAWRYDLLRRMAQAKNGSCSAALLPVGSDPVEPCIVRGKHDAHQNAAGQTWKDAEITE